MAERICALLGSGKGPRVPCSQGDRIHASGGVSNFQVSGPDYSFEFNGVDGLHEVPYSGFVQIEHDGAPTAAFFLLRG